MECVQIIIYDIRCTLRYQHSRYLELILYLLNSYLYTPGVGGVLPLSDPLMARFCGVSIELDFSTSCLYRLL